MRTINKLDTTDKIGLTFVAIIFLPAFIFVVNELFCGTFQNANFF